jgi:hypothetical protein
LLLRIRSRIQIRICTNNYGSRLEDPKNSDSTDPALDPEHCFQLLSSWYRYFCPHVKNIFKKRKNKFLKGGTPGSGSGSILGTRIQIRFLNPNPQPCQKKGIYIECTNVPNSIDIFFHKLLLKTGQTDGTCALPATVCTFHHFGTDQNICLHIRLTHTTCDEKMHS